MTFFVPTARTQITGLTASTWNRDVNVGSFAAVEPGATTVLLETKCTSGTGQAYGFQPADAGSDNLFASSPRFERFDFVSLQASNLIDLYTGNTTTTRHFIRGYTDHITLITPEDVTSQLITSGVKTITSSTVPDGAGAALVQVAALRMALGGVGTTGSLPFFRCGERQQVIVPLNSSKQFEVNAQDDVTTANSLVVIGWLPEGAYIPSASPGPDGVAVSTWEDLAVVDTNPISIFVTYNSTGSQSSLFGMAPGGTTSGDQTANAHKFNPVYVLPNGSGEFAAYSNSTDVSFYHRGSLVALTSDPDPSIDIDPEVTDTSIAVGVTQYIGFEDLVSPPESITLVYDLGGADEVSIEQSSFALSSVVDGVATATFTTVIGNLPYTSASYPSSDYTYVVTCADASEITLTGVAIAPAITRSFVTAVDPVSDETGILYQWESGGPVTGDQVDFLSSAVTVREDFTFFGPAGESDVTLNINYWDSVSQIRYPVSVIVSFDESGEGTVTGFAERGFTAEGFTVRGFAVRGF